MMHPMNDNKWFHLHFKMKLQFPKYLVLAEEEDAKQLEHDYSHSQVMLQINHIGPSVTMWPVSVNYAEFMSLLVAV